MTQVSAPAHTRVLQGHLALGRGVRGPGASLRELGVCVMAGSALLPRGGRDKEVGAWPV